MTEHRGHAITTGNTEQWIYTDRLTPVADDPDRDCGRCGLPNTSAGHDGCIANLSGNVTNACCGHGDNAIAYVQIRDGRHLEGAAALAFMAAQGAGPLAVVPS